MRQYDSKCVKVDRDLILLMQHEAVLYCEHFEYLKISDSLLQEREASCCYCFQGTGSLWLCLSKGCTATVCAKNNYEHLQSHLEESRKNKKFHSIFINMGTAEIRCVQCGLEICDLDTPRNASLKGKQDPFPHRLKLLPGLADLTHHKIVGQLENSEGHRRISHGLVGIFANKYNYTINSALQFLAHCKFIREVLLQMRVSQKNKVLVGLQGVVQGVENAQYRAVHSDTLCELLYKEMPELLGYRRKDPFDLILHFLNLINDHALFYAPSSNAPEDLDEWDLFYRRGMLEPQHLIYSAIESTLSLNYFCPKCQASSSVPHNIQFLKLNIPKKKRRTKEVEKELASHRYGSPVKNRRKSLINLFKQEECPLTIPELLIQLMKSPLHKQMRCEKCEEPLKKTKLHFSKLPDILVIQVARIGKERSLIDDTEIELSTEALDMGSLTDTPEEEIIYDFESAVCIEKKCLFPLVVIGQSNKQQYVIRNEIVELSKEKMNPYILCYRRRPSETARQKATMIKDDLTGTRELKYRLPDFWYIQLQNGIERPFRNQFVCKHNALKPHVDSKMLHSFSVSADVYEDLAHFYKNIRTLPPSPTLSKRSSLSPRMPEGQFLYHDQPCATCAQEVEVLAVRRRKEREQVLGLDKLRGEGLPYCMISSSWIKKWSSYLYSNERFAYMPRGFPLPPPIDNKSLLQGNKCKPNLVRNDDFKILNIYLWRFLRELYGGGPQIRYKWKETRENLDEHMIADIKEKAFELKSIYSPAPMDSPKKLITSLSFIERSSITESFRENSFIHPPAEEEIEDIEEEKPQLHKS